jgi:hypothetical protein
VFSVAEARTRAPEAVTTSTAATLSQAQPTERLFHPWPPCSRNPPMPTLGQCPPGNARPRDARKGASCRPPRTDGPATAIAVLSSYAIWLMFDKSMSRPPSRTLHAAQE